MAKARNTDPATSHEAAESVKQETITRTQQFILDKLQKPMTDEQLVLAFRKDRKAPLASESGIRSRRAELARRHLLMIVDEAKTASGRRAYVWKIAGDC